MVRSNEVYSVPGTVHAKLTVWSVVAVDEIVAAPGRVRPDAERGVPTPAAFNGTTVTEYCLAGASPVKVAVGFVTVRCVPPGSSVTS